MSEDSSERSTHWSAELICKLFSHDLEVDEETPGDAEHLLVTKHCKRCGKKGRDILDSNDIEF